VAKWRWYLNIIIVFTVSGLWHGASWTFATWGFISGILISLSHILKGFKDRVRSHFINAVDFIPGLVYFFMGIIGIGFFASASKFGLIPKFSIGFLIFLSIVFGLVSIFGLYKHYKKDCNSIYEKAIAIWQMIIIYLLFAFPGVFFSVRTMNDAYYILTHWFRTDIARPGMVRNIKAILFTMTDISIMIILIITIFAVNAIQENKGSIREIIRRKPAIIRWLAYYFFIMLIFTGMYKSAGFVYFNF
jgi:D-alanyl-lipoteichoic acid acyltransferase DltB (MBOAT superfamily)